MVEFREAGLSDVDATAQIRAKEWQTKEYWFDRITRYLEGRGNPQEGLEPRVMYVAMEDGIVVGFVAGHLTQRYGCDGELQWIDVVAELRRRGMATKLLRLIALWFVSQGARRICVDPGNSAARQLYQANGAEELNQHWMVWNDIGLALGE
jgi:GNAT superfamily N-acetyltransferase